MGEIIGPIIGLAAVTLPIWIVWSVLHYKSKNRELGSLDAHESQQLEELNNLAEQMAERIKTLETILDAESPEWREQHGEQQK